MDSQLSRRELLASTGLMLAGGAASSLSEATAVDAAKSADTKPFGYCLNTSTIRGQKLGLVAEIEIAAKVGYDAVELWIREIDRYVQHGGSLKDLGKRIRDAGLTVESGIGFAPWIVDDDDRRRQGLEQAKRDMDMLRQIGGKRMAAPPAGATQQSDLDLFKAARRYRALLELGEQMGVVPQVEMWGASKSLSRLSESVFVAVESGHASACLLPDVYHIYKGGSDFAGLKLLSASAIHVFHVNDYPAEPRRDEISDADRVYPGDGVAPLRTVFRTLRDNGCRCMLSLELFNRGYWEQDALTVAQTGLEKTKAVVERALA